MLLMEKSNSNAYIAPEADVLAIMFAGIVCSSTTESTRNERYTEEIYEW